MWCSSKEWKRNKTGWLWYIIECFKNANKREQNTNSKQRHPVTLLTSKKSFITVIKNKETRAIIWRIHSTRRIQKGRKNNKLFKNLITVIKITTFVKRVIKKRQTVVRHKNVVRLNYQQLHHNNCKFEKYISWFSWTGEIAVIFWSKPSDESNEEDKRVWGKWGEGWIWGEEGWGVAELELSDKSADHFPDE